MVLVRAAGVAPIQWRLALPSSFLLVLVCTAGAQLQLQSSGAVAAVLAAVVRKNLLDIEQKFVILGTTKAAEGILPPTRSYSERAHSSNGQALVRV